MKCVNAEWELRNLGVKTIEISIEKSDSNFPTSKLLQTVENFRQEYDAKYVVVKSDAKYPAISIDFQRAGFWLMENQIGLKAVRRDLLKAFEDYKKIFYDEVSYRAASDDDIKMVCAEIEKGMFTTDRIALDPHFGIEIANHRYVLWLKDELKRGALLHLTLHEGNTIGFFLDKITGEKKLAGLLGGIFKNAESQNLGAAYMYAGRIFFADTDWKETKTAVSSNNLNILNLLLMFGHKITDIKNVLVKHFD